MADARSLLRAARVERRIQHPLAHYTGSGKLLCSLCGLAVKDDKKAWSSHLSSSQHTAQQARAEDAEEARASRKRKVDDLEEAYTVTDEEDGNKRRAVGQTSVERTEEDEAGLMTKSGSEAAQDDINAPQTQKLQDATAEAEFADFMKEMQQFEAANPDHTDGGATNALSAAATISAAPMTAEQIAAQAREEQSAQRGRRDAEIEGEREDAEERLQEEFEEMEGFEDRVKRLKEKRAALRRTSAEDPKPPDLGVGDGGATAGIEVLQEKAEPDEGADGEASDDEDYDDWTFGAR